MARDNNTRKQDAYKFMDWASDTVLYTGWTENPGTPTSSPLWSIRKRTFDANGGWTDKYANNADTFINIWDNRASYF